jgi:membrane-associated PAP2 superfamily phosphatase
VRAAGRRSSPARRDASVAAWALVALLAWEASGLDMVLASAYGGASGFALRHSGWTQHLLHDGGRWLSALALLACTGWAWHGGAAPLAMTRRRRGAWLLAILAGLVLVPALKRLSHTSCPWDLALFGGNLPYVPHWLPTLIDGGPGHCFPSGHAVAAFAFLPLYFQWRGHRPALARALLAAVLILGALFGWAQLARGAHFPSHTLWSAWLCWVIGVVAAWRIDPVLVGPLRGIGAPGRSASLMSPGPASLGPPP